MSLLGKPAVYGGSDELYDDDDVNGSCNEYVRASFSRRYRESQRWWLINSNDDNDPIIGGVWYDDHVEGELADHGGGGRLGWEGEDEGGGDQGGGGQVEIIIFAILLLALVDVRSLMGDGLMRWCWWRRKGGGEAMSRCPLLSMVLWVLDGGEGGGWLPL